MSTANRFFNETFSAALGTLASSQAHETQYQNIQAACKLIQDELDALQGLDGITDLGGFPASFDGAGLKYLRVNAAESAIEFVSGGNVSIKVIAGTSYTLLATDAGQLLIFTNAAAVTVTVPPDVLAQGDVVCMRQGGAGQVTLEAGAGVTLNSSDDLLSTRAQHAQIFVVCDDTNVFGVGGERNAPTLTLYVDHQLSCSNLTSNLAIANGVAYFRVPRAMKNVSFRASLLVASTSGAVTIDVNVNTSSILSTKLTIDQDEKTSVTAATPAVQTTTTLAEDDEVAVDIDGAGTGAKGLILTVLGELA